MPRSPRFSLVLALVLGACGQPAEAPPTPAAPDPGPTLVREDPTDGPIPGLEGEALARFEEGDALFNLPFRDAQGLGPLYVHRSCASCHEADARGPGAVRRLAFLGPPEARAEALPFGDVVRPRAGGAATTTLAAPTRADVEERARLGPPTFARGYLEAIPDETLLAYERAQASRDDGIQGRAHRVPRASAIELAPWLPRLGRFGLKGRIASLDEFVADALLSDMGLTTPLRPVEPPNPDGLTDDARPGVDLERAVVQGLVDYVRLLAIPRREAPDARGASLFVEARCAVCHVPTVQTRADHPEPSLAGVEVALFTDLLLHDMGEALADGIAEHEASGRQWQTPALIGLRHQRALLHDGRAATVREAVDAHAAEGSEAADSHARFAALPRDDQEALVRYVEAL